MTDEKQSDPRSSQDPKPDTKPDPEPVRPVSTDVASEVSIDAASESSESQKSAHSGSERGGKGSWKGGDKKLASQLALPRLALKDLIINIYDTQYKKLLVIPAAVIIAAVIVLLVSFSSTGSFFKKDVSLSGGVSVSAITGFSDEIALEEELSQRFPNSDIGVRKLTQVGKGIGVVVEANMQSSTDIDALLGFLSDKLGISKEDLTVQKVGASLGQSFFRQMVKGLIIAFVFMAITVFVYFKVVAGKWVWLPGLFVVWTAFVDMLCTLAVISLSGIHLSAAGLAAFLMLIGYSVDTDILLTVRALTGKELKLAERIRSAVRTGVLMSLTAFGAATAGYFFAEAETIKQIMFIIAVGMVFDIIHTWITNAGLLRWYLEKHGMV